MRRHSVGVFIYLRFGVLDALMLGCYSAKQKPV